MPSITSNRFYFTSDGLMWFSTANGLTSFDGTSVLFHNSAKQAIETELNKIFSFAEDSLGNLYIGTRTKLIYFNRRRKAFAILKYTNKLSGKEDNFSISDIYYDKKNNLVITGTHSRGLLIYHISTGVIEHLNLDLSKKDDWDNRINNTVVSIAPHYTDDSKLWIGTFNGICLFDKRTKQFSKSFNVANPSKQWDGTEKLYYDIQHMEVLNDSVIWFNSWAGGLGMFNTYNSSALIFLQKELVGAGKGFGGPIIPSFCRLSGNLFFIGAHNNFSGVFDAGTQKIHHVNITGIEKAYDKLEFVTTDRQNNLWVLRNGMLYTTLPAYARIKTTDISWQLTPNNAANELRGIHYDQAGKKYYGAVRHSSGVYVFDSSFNLLEIIPTPLFTNRYTYRETCTDQVAIDGSGRIWVTGHETYMKLPGQKKFDYIRNVLPALSWIEKKGEYISMFATKTGDIILRGYDAHVYIINHKTLAADTLKIQKFDYNGNYIITHSPILYDSVRSFLYYSNEYGVIQYHLQTKAKQILNPGEYVGKDQSERPMLKMAIDDSGRVWSLVRSNLRILDPVSLKCIDSFSIGSRGLRTENYSNIINGGKNYMFLQGQNGVVIYNYKSQQSLLFDNINGLKYPLAYSINYCNNHLILGQSDAVQYYNTEDFSKNNFLLKPRVNIIQSDTIIVYEREISDSLKVIRLRYFQNNLRFSFSAPEFIFPERIEYAYRLDGFEDEWQYASYFKREVSYTRLKPGKYIFLLKAQVQDGNWETEPVEYTIIIKAAIWQTFFFKIFLLLSGVAGVFLFFRFRIQTIRRKERQKAVHEKELFELEARALRAQMNPHFIFNCLNSIKSLIQQDERDKSVAYLTTFSKLIRTLFNNADKKQISLYDEIETCKLYLQLEAMRFDARFSYSIQVDEGIDLKSIQVPALIVQPFIENAVWHGIMPKDSGGNIVLQVARDNGNVNIVVDDNGIGREASQQNKSESNIGHQSKGVNLTQSRLELDNLLQQRQAKLVITDKTDDKGRSVGTCVVISFPQEA